MRWQWMFAFSWDHGARNRHLRPVQVWTPLLLDFERGNMCSTVRKEIDSVKFCATVKYGAMS